METANYNVSKYAHEFKAKKHTKSIAGAIGWTLFISELGVSLIAIVIGVVLAFTGIGTDILSDEVFNQFLNMALTLVIFIAAPIICCRILKRKMRSVMPLHLVSPALFLGSVLVGFGFNSVSNIVASAFSGIFSMFGVNPGNGDIALPSGISGFIISILTVAVVPALIEEFAFRGFILGTLRKAVSDGAAIFVSAFLFGVMHGNLAQIPFAFCMGLVLAYITVLTNSVWPAIVTHFLNNAMSVILDFSLKNAGPISTNIISCLYLLITCIFLVVGIILIHGKIKEHRLQFAKNDISASKYIKWSLLCPGVIFFMITVVIGLFLN